MNLDRIWNILVVKTEEPKKHPKLLFSWETKEQYRNIQRDLDRASHRYKDRDDDADDTKFIGLRGEMGAEEIYPLVRIFHTNIINRKAIEIAEALIKTVYPKSNIYWYPELEKDLGYYPNKDHTGYCSGMWLRKGFCPSFLAHYAMELLDFSYSRQKELEEDYYLWALKEL